METIAISSHLTKHAYSKLLLSLVYTKAYHIVATILGFYFASFFILQLLQILDLNPDSPFFFGGLGIFAILMAPINILIALRTYKANHNLNEEMKSTFGEDGIVGIGVTCEVFLIWTHFKKQGKSTVAGAPGYKTNSKPKINNQNDPSKAICHSLLSIDALLQAKCTNPG
ncbi:MAG: hypothetical protein ACHQET_03975 [Chitinophagales bacterium]